MVQQRGLAPPRAAAQAAVLGLGDLAPGQLFVTAGQRRHAVDRTVEPVEVMGKLVYDHIVAVGLVAAGLQDVAPGDDDRAMVPGLARQVRRAGVVPELGRVLVDARIDDHRLQPVEVIGLFETQDQQRGLGGDGDLHLVGHRDLVAAEPALLGDHHVDDRLGQGPLARPQIRVVPKVGVEIAAPSRRKRLVEQCAAAAILEPRHGARGGESGGSRGRGSCQSWPAGTGPAVAGKVLIVGPR